MRDKITPSSDLKKMVVLYVEDEDSIRESLSLLIQRHVKTIHLAKDGLEGLELFKEVNPDIVITDIQMPKLNGLEMTRKIKEISKDVKILVTTAFGDSEYLLAAIELEINGYIIKPLDRNKLFSLLNENAKNVLNEKRRELFRRYAQQIIDFQKNMIAVLDTNAGIIKCNKSFLSFFGMGTLKDFEEKYTTLNSVLNEREDEDYIKSIDADVLAYVIDNPSKKHLVSLSGGIDLDEKAFALHATKLTNEDGLAEYIISLTDVTIFESENRKLEKIAIADKLTGIYNRVKFEDSLDKEMKSFRDTNAPFSIIFFDIDHFKKVNDTYGHDVGDEVLKNITSIVGAKLRGSDIFARWGGEEFIILLPRTPLQSAKELAERLRIALEETKMEKVGVVTCSFGISEVKEFDDKKECIKRADEALYRAKNNGRNRVEIG